jgi:hypothetical protein
MAGRLNRKSRPPVRQKSDFLPVPSSTSVNPVHLAAARHMRRPSAGRCWRFRRELRTPPSRSPAASSTFISSRRFSIRRNCSISVLALACTASASARPGTACCTASQRVIRYWFPDLAVNASLGSDERARSDIDERVIDMTPDHDSHSEASEARHDRAVGIGRTTPKQRPRSNAISASKYVFSVLMQTDARVDFANERGRSR